MTGATTKDEDFVTDVFVATSHAYIMPLTSRGKVYSLRVHEIPLGSRTSRGKPIVNLVRFQEGEKLSQVLVAREFTENSFVVFVTRRGVVKRTDLSSFANIRANGLIALGIDDGDALVSCQLTDGTKDILLSTAQGMAIRFAETDVRSMGRNAYGVKGITLGEGDVVVSAEVLERDATIFTVTENGYGKRTSESEYRVQTRGGKGLIDIKTTERNGLVIGTLQVRDDDEVMLITSSGVLIRMPVRDISVIGRNTQGVRLITLDEAGGKVVGISRLPRAENEPEESGEATAPTNDPESTDDTAPTDDADPSDDAPSTPDAPNDVTP